MLGIATNKEHCVMMDLRLTNAYRRTRLCRAADSGVERHDKKDNLNDQR